MNKPLLSIVIANYNYGNYIEDALMSIFRQCGTSVVDDSGVAVLPIKGCKDLIEVIVCDAGSTDSSLDIIKKYETKIAWWCSEKDKGQSEAFNKGFSHSRGYWLTWLNADDMYFRNVLLSFSKLVHRKPKADWITSNQVFFDSSSSRIVSLNWGPHCQLPFIKGYRAYSAVYGPTSFISRHAYDEIGPIDEKMHFSMDTDYWARMTVAGIRQNRLNMPCWAFRIHRDSKTQGVQDENIYSKRLYEHNYSVRKTGYTFRPSFRNPWYIMWVLWRVVDGSLIMRSIMKHKYDGKSILTFV